MKAFMLLVNLAVLYAMPPNLPPVDEVIAKEFRKAFSHIANVSWNPYGELWEASYTDNKIKVKLTYNTKGEIVNSYRYYDKEALNPFILTRLSQKYPNHSVFGVTEVHTESDLIYYVVLQDASTWYHVEVTASGVISLSKKYKKS